MKLFSLLAFSVFSALPLFAADGLRITFSPETYSKKTKLPEKWHLQGKLFTAKPDYEIVFDKALNTNVLRVTTDKASGAILYDITGVLQKYPVMRWKWRVDALPKGADGRYPDVDDQAISLYVGVGRISTNSVSYRWDTETPKQSRGNVAYGAGMVKVDWLTLRNKEDLVGVWHTDQVNAAEDLKRICGGKLPDHDVALSICTNSQYTKSRVQADVAWIEFLPLEALKEKTE